MTIVFAEPIDQTWGIVEAQLSEQTKTELNIRDLAVVKNLFNEKSEIWLGVPQVTCLPSAAMTELLDYDFLFVQISCSFRPAPQCEFVRATLKVYLEEGSQSSAPPIAYELFPTEIVMPVTYKRSLSISPSFKMELVKVAQVEASAFKYELTKDYILYQPQITAFGKGNSTFGWDFNKTSSRRIQGITDLFFVVKKARLSMTSMRLELSDCRVQTNIGPIPLSTIFLSGSDKPLIEKVYPL